MERITVKPVFFSLAFSFFLQSLVAQEAIEEKKIPFFEDEISTLEQLIAVNERKLVVQKNLKEKMEIFRKQKEEFLLGNQSKTHAFAMVSTARQLLATIKEEHLSYLFATEYLEELIFFSSIAAKSVPIKP